MLKNTAALLLVCLIAWTFYARVLRLEETPAAVPASAASFYITAQGGAPVSVSCAELELQLGMESGTLKGLTLTSLPGEGEGSLLLDGMPALLYEPISRERSQGLVMLPAAGAARVGFSFLPQTPDSVPATVYVNIGQEENSPPEAADLTLHTLREIAVTGFVSAWDADGDEMHLVITAKPAKGAVETDGLRLTYKPFAGSKGKDSLKLRACDARGAYSGEIQVDIAIGKAALIRFADMQGSTGEYAALRLYEAGVMTGEQIGTRQLFYPERTLTHAEFIVLLLSAAGLDTALPASVNTGLPMDSTIPLWQKPYIKTARERGLLPACFTPASELTCAQAVEYIDAVMRQSAPERASLRFDSAAIPASALPAYARLHAMGLLESYDAFTQPEDLLTRALAAQLLLPVYENRSLVAASPAAG